ncbi:MULTISPECIES: I78 family peptidase inhibitor [Novosphingobium]|uniref:I78 family peptidase inhibitor n=1 Tax=Novosphingobium TaxID=165696 RepID=UPI000D6E82BB|nr:MULTISPECIES: I78 family peptidase inhibitor [Novosphingobium]
MKRFLVLSPVVLFAQACASPQESAELPRQAQAGVCNADNLQSHVGHKASAASGETLLRLSGARTLRWGPPRSAMTMDYRADRLTVAYDDDYTIVRISCG